MDERNDLIDICRYANMSTNADIPWDPFPSGFALKLCVRNAFDTSVNTRCAI
jgi:hypothetical protein